jgi:prepilin-type processing-associated H-X9-DG protein
MNMISRMSSNQRKGMRPPGARLCAFTLVELLVVIGLIGLLIGILLPALSVARESSRRVYCSSNLRQIVAGAMLYITEYRGYWPPAHLYFFSQNNDRWHGTRPDNNSPFDFETSRMRKELGTVKIRECPSFTFTEGSVGFERSSGGYGYNDEYLGSGLGVPELAHLSLPLADYEARVVNTPAKASQIKNPAEKIAFTDAAIANPSIIEYSFVTPPLDVDGNTTSPSIHFRHRHRANIAWADGHVTSESMDWTYPVNVYGAKNGLLELGFFGPKDNRLFQRE